MGASPMLAGEASGHTIGVAYANRWAAARGRCPGVLGSRHDAGQQGPAVAGPFGAGPPSWVFRSKEGSKMLYEATARRARRWLAGVGTSTLLASAALVRSYEARNDKTPR